MIPQATRKSRLTRTVLLATALLGCGTLAYAETPEHRVLSYDPAADTAQTLRQYQLDVDDAPAHALRIYEVKRVYVRQPPEFAGVRATESLEHGIADLVDQAGTEVGYVIFSLEGGERVFGRYRGSIATQRWPDGSRHYDIRRSIELTGGTGAFARVRGAIRMWEARDPGADSSQGGAEGEYWLER